jgi:hypothetical protein
MAEAVEQQAAPPGSARLVAAAVAGGAVAVALGVYAEVHDPANEQPYRLFFTGTIQLKAWFATLALVFAGFQVVSALRLYGRIGDPETVPDWLGDAHRLSGTLAFLVTLPVAYHCLWSLGFSDLDTRTLLHSIFGCAFYGAFVTKEATYVSSCAGCHGAGGQGGLGPQLADGAVVAAFPDEADQVEVVAEGRGGMPGFGDRLSPEQVAAVVAFTREDL